jgi:hypothetical protein
MWRAIITHEQEFPKRAALKLKTVPYLTDLFFKSAITNAAKITGAEGRGTLHTVLIRRGHLSRG